MAKATRWKISAALLSGALLLHINVDAHGVNSQFGLQPAPQ